MTDILLVYITTPSKEEAKRIAGALIEESLAACANIIPAVESLYRWQGELRQSEESLLLLLTNFHALWPLPCQTDCPAFWIGRPGK